MTLFRDPWIAGTLAFGLVGWGSLAFAQWRDVIALPKAAPVIGPFVFAGLLLTMIVHRFIVTTIRKHTTPYRT